MAGRRANGEGTIYRRRNGRYEAAIYLPTTSGKSKRVRFHGKTREEALSQLTEAKAQAQRGIPIADQRWRLDAYLDYWLEEVVRTNRRPTTYHRYELAVRLYLKPGLGHCQLARLSVQRVQAFLNGHLADGRSVRSVQILREVLSSALTRACREELIMRNVARLVELPTWQRGDIQPWSADEAKRFLAAARSDPLYPAFLVMVVYGLRRGEVLGLRWRDIDFVRGVIHVRQQVQRVGGALRQGPVKTQAGRRDLPLLIAVRTVLADRRSTYAPLADAVEGGGLVFTTRTALPIEPRNFVRSFRRVCSQHGIRLIRVHDVRHTTATLLKIWASRREMPS